MSVDGGRRGSMVATALCVVVLLSGCTAMMLGGSGSAGRPIGGNSSAPPSSSASDLRITAVVRNHLNYDDELAGHRIQIDTRDGVVTLRGAVGSFEQRDRAARLAADVADVDRVVNQLTIER